MFREAHKLARGNGMKSPRLGITGLTEETLPTILSADPNTISIMINTMPEDVRAQIRLEMMKMMREALDDGYIDPQFEEKLSALEGEWHFKTPSAPSV